MSERQRRKGDAMRAAEPAKIKVKKRKAKLSLTLEEAMRRDLIFLNNPVLVQGLALTPVVAVATTLKNAGVLIILALLLVPSVRVLGEVVAKRAPGRLRVMFYALFSAVIYIPALLIINLLFGSGAVGAGIYLPVFVADGIVLSRGEISSRESAALAFSNGFRTAIGLSGVLVIVGALRELLGEGKLFGTVIFSNAPLPIASTVAGGFIVAALLAALLQWGAVTYKNARAGGVTRNE